MQELQELNEMIGENDSKYKKIIKDNREALDKTLRELREKEEEYHNVLVELDRINQQKEESLDLLQQIEKDIKVKDDLLNKLIANLELSQIEITRINQNMISLAEREQSLVRSSRISLYF